MVATVDLFDYLNVMDDYLPIIVAQIQAKMMIFKRKIPKMLCARAVKHCNVGSIGLNRATDRSVE
jgi:hypothetical protein